MLNIDHKNKVVLVTGASKGMGYKIAELFALSGAKVFLVARNKKNLIISCKNIRKQGGKVEYLAADVSTKNIENKIFSKCKKKFGKVDILINNAGGPPMGTLFEHSVTNWERSIKTNLMSVVKFSKLALKDMKYSNWGRIITITSTVTKEPSPEMVLSATTRGGLSAFNKSICLEFAKYNITSNIISPGGVMTERLINLFKEKSKRSKINYSQLVKSAQDGIPTKRFAKPEEIANVILFLCSDLASYINGVDLTVDGGLTRSI